MRTVLISIDDRALYTTSSHEQSTWIVDSGATVHMCHDRQSFTDLYQLENPIDVVLGDGRALTAVGRGEVVLDMFLPNGESRSCTLCDVLYVPQLSHNLISVAKATQTGKVVKFTKSACYMLNRKHQMVAKATKVGSLYQLDYKPNHEQASVAEKSDFKEDIWHKRFGHLGIRSLQRLAREELANGFNFDVSQTLSFCEMCPLGKQHQTKFPSSSTRATEPLELVHSDVWGKMNVKSESGAEYFFLLLTIKHVMYRSIFYAERIKFLKSFESGRL